jgi:dihydrolipoamide dehydrogenase
LKTKVTGGKVSSAGIKVDIEGADGSNKSQLDADIVLVSTGRRPFTSGL